MGGVVEKNPGGGGGGKTVSFVLFAFVIKFLKYLLFKVNPFLLCKNLPHRLVSTARKDSDSACGEIHHYRSESMTQHGYNCIALQCNMPCVTIKAVS